MYIGGGDDTGVYWRWILWIWKGTVSQPFGRTSVKRISAGPELVF